MAYVLIINLMHELNYINFAKIISSDVKKKIDSQVHAMQLVYICEVKNAINVYFILFQ